MTTEDQGFLSADQIHLITLLVLGNVKMPRSPVLLSDREAAAIELKAAGLTNASIGRHLGISHVAVGKYFKKRLVRDCLKRYIATDGKEFYPEPVYANRAERQAAKIERQRRAAFTGWLTQRLVDVGTLENPEKLHVNLKQVMGEAKRFWLGYFREYEPELSKEEIEYFFRKE